MKSFKQYLLEKEDEISTETDIEQEENKEENDNKNNKSLSDFFDDNKKKIIIDLKKVTKSNYNSIENLLDETLFPFFINHEKEFKLNSISNSNDYFIKTFINKNEKLLSTIINSTDKEDQEGENLIDSKQLEIVVKWFLKFNFDK